MRYVNVQVKENVIFVQFLQCMSLCVFTLRISLYSKGDKRNIYSSHVFSRKLYNFPLQIPDRHLQRNVEFYSYFYYNVDIYLIILSYPREIELIQVLSTTSGKI